MFRKTIASIFIGFSLFAYLPAGSAFALDAKTAIRNAKIAMGDIKSVRYAGTGKLGAVGMNWNPTGPWHSTDLTSYTRTIDYGSASSREDLTRAQENPTALGGEAPFFGPITEGRQVSGKYAWNQPADGNPPVAPDVVLPAPATADERWLQIWLTPHGFLKAASTNAAVASQAIEGGKRVTTVAFTAGKYKITGTIDGRNLVTRIETKIPNPVLGDMPVEVTFSNYKRFGEMEFPTQIMQLQGGSRTFELNVTSAQANVANAVLTVPANVLTATIRPEEVKTEKMADGVWMLYGGHNSVLVEFKDYLAVIDAPLDEARSLAVISAVRKLLPGKPIKYVINTHHHFDHSGGLRTYVAEGATIITHEANTAFYQWAWKQPRTMEPDRLSQNPREPTFITFKNKYVLTDGDRTIEVYLDFGDMHDQYLSFAYLPKERILVEADDFSAWYVTPLSLAMWNNLYGNLQRLQLDPVTIAPLHGPITQMDVWLKTLRDSTAR
jgi:hypothetical protein